MIVRKAIQSPVRQIAENAGTDGTIVLGKLTDKGDPNFQALCYFAADCFERLAVSTEPSVKNAVFIRSTSIVGHFL